VLATYDFLAPLSVTRALEHGVNHLNTYLPLSAMFLAKASDPANPASAMAPANTASDTALRFLLNQNCRLRERERLSNEP
jgi:hypothetical protein